MIKSIGIATQNYNNANQCLVTKNSTNVNPNSVSFSANLSKAPKPMSKFISIPLRIGEEIIEAVGRLRLGDKLDRRFGKMTDEGKELSNKINTILGDKRKVRITKKTVLVVNPTLTPKEIMDMFLNDSLPPEELKANAQMFRDIANNYDELPFAIKPLTTSDTLFPDENLQRLIEKIKQIPEDEMPITKKPVISVSSDPTDENIK